VGKSFKPAGLVTLDDTIGATKVQVMAIRSVQTHFCFLCFISKIMFIGGLAFAVGVDDMRELEF